AVGDAVQPAADLLPRRDRGGLADEDEERGLEGVLRVVDVADDAPADVEHHRAVAAHQGREGRLIAPADEPAQQLPVRQVLGTAVWSCPATSRPSLAITFVLLAGSSNVVLTAPGGGGASIFFRILRAATGRRPVCHSRVPLGRPIPEECFPGPGSAATA